MQVWENLAKYIYYSIWQYPGILWFGIFPLAFCLNSYLIISITKISWKLALPISIASFVSGVIFGLLFMFITVVKTPGS